MTVINISIPEELFKEVEKYRKINKENRSEFFKNAAQLYFKKINVEIAHERRLKAFKELLEIADDMKKRDIFKSVDVVGEIRKMRKERTNELLGRLK